MLVYVVGYKNILNECIINCLLSLLFPKQRNILEIIEGQRYTLMSINNPNCN